MASALRLRASAGPAPVVALRTSTRASSPADRLDDARRRPRVQPEPVGAPRAALAPRRARPRGAAGASLPARPRPAARAFMRSAPRASRGDLVERRAAAARAAAATAPSTSGASESRTGPPSGSAISTAISALSRALPRSISTSTPSAERARPTPPARAASVPIAPSSIPPAASIATSAPPISRASSTTPSASAELWETMTRPTTRRSSETGGAVEHFHRVHRLHPGRLLDLPAARLGVAHRPIRASAAIWSNRPAPTCIAMSYFSRFRP